MYSSISSKDAYLRLYQQEAKDNIFKVWNEVSSVMLQMPTGTGKTVLFSSIIKDIHNWMISAKVFKKVLIIVHRTELIEQTKDKLGIQYHVASGVIAGNYSLDLKPQVQIASIQTLTHPNNEPLASRLDVGFIIIDEAHHALAASYQKLWSLYPNAKKLGVTATPWRMNHAGFTDLFDQLIQSWTIRKFIEKKYLAKFKYYSIRPSSEEQRAIDSITEYDIEGDYKISAMERAMDNGRIRANLLESYLKYAKGKRGIIYAITRAHGKKICTDFQKAGVNIDYIDSVTKPKERKLKVEKFRKGEIEVLVNVDIFSEGFDCPALDFVQMARPTRSLVKYLQQVGRALRPNGRKQAIILDNVGMFKRFGLPDANRKWAYHFKGIDVDECGYDEEHDNEYTNNVSRLNDISEGCEEMVLLNGKHLEQEEEEDMHIEKTDCPSIVDLMVEKLDLLGIEHGIVFNSNGLLFDWIETEAQYVYRQISIRFGLRYNKLLTIPKDSVLGKLCKEFGPCFSPNIKIDSSGDFYYEDGMYFQLGNLQLCVDDSLQLCHDYDANNKAWTAGKFEMEDFDASKYKEDLLNYLETGIDTSVEKEISKLKEEGYFKDWDLFYLENHAYSMKIDDNSVSINQIIISSDSIQAVLVAQAKKDTYLYNSCKLFGKASIRYIRHFGGKYSFIIFDSDSGNGVIVSSFAGNILGCIYDFEIENRYNYAKAVGSESIKDTITIIEKNEESKNDSIDIRFDMSYESPFRPLFWFHFVQEENQKGSAYIIGKKSGDIVNIAHHVSFEELREMIRNRRMTPIATPVIVKKALGKRLNNQSSKVKLSADNTTYTGYDMSHKFITRQKDGNYATGYYNPVSNHFVVAKGCVFPANVSSSFERNATRNRIINECCRKKGDYYILNHDYQFDSPSTAACIIKGYSANGFVEWKTEDGKTLKTVYNK